MSKKPNDVTNLLTPLQNVNKFAYPAHNSFINFFTNLLTFFFVQFYKILTSIKK